MTGRTRRCVVALIVACLCSPPSGRALAQSGATLVAVVTAEPNSALTRRVRAELQGLGVDVIVLKPPEEGSAWRAPLEQAARSVGAIAAVRLVPSSEGKVEVWVADRVTGKAVVRELDAPRGGASDAAVAVGSVELLRASLMELHSGEPLHGDAPASEKVRSLGLPLAVAEAVPRLGLGVGAGVEVGTQGMGPSPGADVGVSLFVTRHVGARVVAHTSLSASHASVSSGGVDVRSQVVGAMVTYAFADTTGPWTPSASVGIAAVHVSATGTAVPPFVSASDATWTAAPVAAVGIAWSFAAGLRLRADGVAAFSLPPVSVSTPTAEVGRWGAPELIFSLGVEVLWRP
jgi:hypothetical protein